MNIGIGNRRIHFALPWQSSLRALGVEKNSEIGARRIWGDLISIYENDIHPYIKIFSGNNYYEVKDWFDRAKGSIEDIERRLREARKYEHVIIALARGLAKVVPNEMEYERGVIAVSIRFDQRIDDVIKVVKNEKAKVAQLAEISKKGDFGKVTLNGIGPFPHHVVEGFLYAFMEIDQRLKPLFKMVNTIFELERKMRGDIIARSKETDRVA